MNHRFLGVILASFCLSSSNLWANPYEEAIKQLKDKKPTVRRQAAESLGKLRNINAVPYLMKLLSDKDPLVRSSAVDALGVLKYRPAAKQIAELLTNDESAVVRQTAAISLGYIGDRTTTEALLKAVDDPHEATRYAAINSLGILRDSTATKALEEKLKDADPRMRKSATHALSKIKDESSIPALIKSLEVSRSTTAIEGGKSMEDALVAASILRTLGEFRDKSLIKNIKEYLDDRDSKVKVAAAHSLQLLDDNSGVPVARKYLKDKNSGTRKLAVDVLGTFGNAQDLKSIKTLDSDPDPMVQQAVKNAVKKISTRIKPTRKTKKVPLKKKTR